MKKHLTAIIILFFLFIGKMAFSQINKPNKEPIKQENRYKQKTIIAKFIEAKTLESAGSYVFKDTEGKTIYFVFDDYYNQKIPYHFFNNEALTNQELVNSIFKIKYISKWEIRGESKEKTWINRIVNIKLIKN